MRKLAASDGNIRDFRRLLLALVRHKQILVDAFPQLNSFSLHLVDEHVINELNCFHWVEIAFI